MNKERQPSGPGRTLIPLDDRAALLALKDFKRVTASPEHTSDDLPPGTASEHQAA
jgi:hypothetical protein